METELPLTRAIVPRRTPAGATPPASSGPPVPRRHVPRAWTASFDPLDTVRRMESAAVPGRTPTGDTETALKRAISGRMLTVFVLGDVVGAGVYALVGNVVAETGGAVWAAFVVASVIAGFTAASYAELVTKFPRAGGAAHYIHNAFRMPAVTFTIAFAVMCSGLASAATLATAFGGDYLATLLDTEIDGELVGVLFLVGMALVNARGISESVKINLGLTAIEVGGLVLVMVIGVAYVFDGGGDVGRVVELEEGANVFLAVFGGAAVAFYALIGFEDSVNVAEETHDPPAVYPRALLVGLSAAALIYLVIGVIASIAVPTARLAGSDAALLEVVRLGPLSVDTKVFSAIALFALANGALINLIMASRLIYGMADQGIMPSPFRRVLPGRRTPWVAIVFTTLLAIGLVLFGDLEDLSSTTVLLLVTVFAVVNAAVLVLRRVEVPHRHFRTPTALPVLGVISSLGIMVDKITDDTKTVMIALVLLGIGFLLWLVNRLLGGEQLTGERLLATDHTAD
jgi:APA family basic amino acid/polyamine antiporter